MLFQKKRQSVADEIAGVKAVKVCGIKCVIRKLNPMIDFRADNIPQIFTDYLSLRKTEPTKQSFPTAQKTLEMLKDVVSAGLLSVGGVPFAKDNKDGLTIADIERNNDLLGGLYLEIMTHTLNRFKGIKGVFFSQKIKQLFAIESLKSMASARLIMLSEKKTI